MKHVTPVRVAIVLAVLALLALPSLGPQGRPASHDEDACASDAADSLQVLFIGNSHTFVNDLPRMFCKLASTERAMRVSSVVGPGWTLRQHWDDGAAIRAIEGRRWNFVVLQEQSGTPLGAPKEFEAAVKKFDALIRGHGSRTAIYELWPRRDVAQNASELHRRYVDVADRAGALLVPAGPAWMRALQLHSDLALYQDDGLHPRPAGTYLTACVFYAALLQKNPERLPGGLEMKPDLTLTLQRIAWDAIGER
jgi:hypothetical protein